MNILKNIGCLLLLILGLSSCSRDLGNYEYRDINEVSISDLGSNYNLVFKADTLKITPTLKGSIDGDLTDQYDYEWKLVPSIAFNDNDWKGSILSRERNLIYPVETLPGSYTLYYKVKDKKTNVTWVSTVGVNIRTLTTVGYMLIGEDKEGYAQADMIAIAANDTVILRDLLKDNGLPKIKGAKDIIHTGRVANPRNIKLWIIGSEQGFYVNSSSFEGKLSNTFNNMYFSSYSLPNDMFPVDIAPRVSAYAGNIVPSGNRVIVTNTGHVFSTSLTTNGDTYSNPVNRLTSLASAPLFQCAPFVFYSAGSFTGYMVYDIENDRFLRGTTTGTNLLTMADGGTNSLFPWNQNTVNRKFVYGENTRNQDGGSTNGNSFALMKDDMNNYHIYKFYMTSNAVQRGYYAINSQYSAELQKASNYAFASTRTALYFSIGSKLYAYDYNPNNERIVLIKDFGEEITMLHCDIQTGNYTNLFVATYNQGVGTLYKMDLQSNTNTIELTINPNNVWTGFSKIKNMSWRNSVD